MLHCCSKPPEQLSVVQFHSGYSDQNPVLYYNSLINNYRLFHSHQKAKSNALREHQGIHGGEGDVEVGSDESTSSIWMCDCQDQLGTQWTEPRELLKEAGLFDRNIIMPSLQSNTIIFIYYAGKMLRLM